MNSIAVILNSAQRVFQDPNEQTEPRDITLSLQTIQAFLIFTFVPAKVTKTPGPASILTASLPKPTMSWTTAFGRLRSLLILYEPLSAQSKLVNCAFGIHQSGHWLMPRRASSVLQVRISS